MSGGKRIFAIKKSQDTEESLYKTLYIKENLAGKIDKLSRDNDISWNKIVISMIEASLSDNEDE